MRVVISWRVVFIYSFSFQSGELARDMERYGEVERERFLAIPNKQLLL